MDAHQQFIVSFVPLLPHFFRKDFATWLNDNWPIYREFERRADALRSLGRRHYSARTIMEAIRFDTDLREKPSELKLKVNNNFVPDCARLYQVTHLGCEEFFERRSGQSTVRTR